MAQSNVVSASKSGATPEDLEAQIAKLRTDFADLADILKGISKAELASLRQAASEKAETARSTASHAADIAASQAKDVQSQINAFMRDQPGAALGVAAGLGFLIGMLSARR